MAVDTMIVVGEGTEEAETVTSLTDRDAACGVIVISDCHRHYEKIFFRSVGMQMGFYL